VVSDDPGQRVTVHVGACRCPGTPHASGDEVYLAPEASMTMGLRGNGAISKADNDAAQLEILLGRVFIEEGITGWTFTDEDGEIGVTPANIERLLPWGKGGSLVAEKANDLYGEAVLGPLVRKSLSTSAPGQTNGSTSRTRPSRSVRRSSLKSSSRGHSAIPR
jgi:hypothetical protein